MLSLDLFDSKYERELREGAVDDLEYRRMNDLREKMEYLMQAYKKADTDEMRQAIMARYNEYKTEREGYMKVREQQVPSKQDPFAYVKPEPKGIGDIQDPKQKMAQLTQRSKKGPLANVAAGIKAFVKGEPEPMGEQTQPRTHAQDVYFEILKAWEDERDYIVIPFPNANPVTMIRGQLWNAIVDLGSIKDPKRRAKYVEERFNDFEPFIKWLANLKRYKVPAKKKAQKSLDLVPGQAAAQPQPAGQPGTAPGSPLMDPEFTGIKPPGNLQEKKKSNDLDAKDVGLSRELQKARARFPAAASDLEAGILDQMDQQQQAQQALAQQQADLNRQDQQIAGLAQANQQQDGVMRAQGQEIDRLTQRLQQVMAEPTAAPAAAPVTPQAEPTAPAAAPAPDMVYVPDAPADTATQDREIARLNKQIQQLELMMTLKTPAERSDLEDRIRDLEKARAGQEEKKRATAKKSAATRQRKKQATTIDMEPAQAQLGFDASGDYLDPSATIGRVRPKPEQGAEVVAAQDAIRKAQKSSRQQAVTNEGQPQELINRYLAINAETDVDAVRKAIQAISRDSTLSATSKSRLLGQIGMIIQRHRLPIGRAYYQFMQQYMEEQTVSETVENVRAGMTEIYRKLAPKIERHRDSFLAGQLYDELENYAELHGAEREFKQMMNGARNRAHMEYDTNPGGFHNWFWFLPFEDNDVEEGIKSQLAGAALAGTLALGAGSASARVTGDEDPGVNRLTGKPNVTQAVQGDQVKPSAPTGFSKEYLQSVVDGTHPRPMVSKEKAQALLNQLKEQGVAEGTDDVKKKMSKLEALALAANRAGDDAKCKMYQQKIQSLKQKLSQSMAEGWSDQGNPTAYSVYIDGREWRAYKSDEQARRVADKVQANLKLQGRDQTVTIAPSRTKRVQEDFGMPGTTIPRKSIIQGYTVYWNPDTQMVSVTRGGDSEQAAIEQARVRNINKDRFLAAAYRMIDRIEELAENISREPRTARERDEMIDKIRRMMTQDRNPANLQIMKKDIEILKTKYRDLKEDSDSTEAVEMAIMRRMLVAHTDLIMRHGLDVVVAAIEEVAYDVGEVDEIGSSDVSAYVRRVQRILEPDNEV